MRFVSAFNDLLTGTINLPPSKLETLTTKVNRVYRALQNDTEFPVPVLGMVRQGSWAHQTIINPRKQREFDADFILELEEEPAWDATPREYRNAIYASLSRNHPYGDMPREHKCRCVRLSYQGDFHLDIVPFVRRAGGGFIVNANHNDWEPADPTGFTDWFNTKNCATDGNLRRVLRILKYIRDGSDWTGTRSVLLTILVGQRIDELRAVTDPSYYGDFPTTLCHVVQDLDLWLQARTTLPPMPDPANSGTDFDHRWDQATYDRLRDRIHTYASTIHKAYDEANPQESRRLWQEVLGEEFQPSGQQPAKTGPFGPVPPAPGRTGRAG